MISPSNPNNDEIGEAALMFAREDNSPPALWGDNGPEHSQFVRSGKWQTNWVIATAVSLVKLNKQTMRNLITTEYEDGTSIDKVMYKLKNSKGTWQDIEVKYDDIPSGADYPDEGYWFLAGLETALLKMGGYEGLGDGNFDKKSIGVGGADNALHIMTGGRARIYPCLTGLQNGIWAELVHADVSPVIALRGKSDTDNTAWAVMSTSGGESAGGKVTLRDVEETESQEEDFNDSVYSDTWYIIQLSGYKTVPLSEKEQSDTVS
ncbi:hypothetical protein IAU59_003334 [Kwoniella sp. CBS 9459]